MPESELTLDDPGRLNLRGRLRFLAKDSLLYGAAYALNKAFAFIVFPLLARHFTVEQYGLIDFFNVLAVLLTTLLVFGQDSAVARFFYEHRDVERRRDVISQSLLFQLAVLMAVLPVLWFLADHVASQLSTAPESARLLRLVVAQCPFLLLINFSQNILKWTFARSRFLLISFGSTVVAVLALFVGVVFFDLTVIQVIATYLVTQALFALLGLWSVRQWLSRPKDWAVLRRMLLFAAPYGVICVVAAGIPVIERSFITQLLGERELGLFAAGAKIAMLVTLPIRAFQVAWGPFSLATFKESDAAETYNWVLKTFSIAMAVVAVAITATAEPLINALAGHRYAGASTVVFCIAFRLAVEAVGWVTSVGIGLSMKSHLNLYAYAAFFGVFMVLTPLLTVRFGLAGVVWGGLLGYAAKTGVESWLAQRAYPLRWDYSGVIWLGVATLCVGLGTQIVAEVIGPNAGSLLAMISLPIIGMLGWFGVFRGDERLRIVKFISPYVVRKSRSVRES